MEVDLVVNVPGGTHLRITRKQIQDLYDYINTMVDYGCGVGSVLVEK